MAFDMGCTAFCLEIKRLPGNPIALIINQFQNIIWCAFEKLTQSRQQSQINSGNLVLAVIIKLCSLHLAIFTDLIFTDILLFQYIFDIYIHLHDNTPSFG